MTVTKRKLVQSALVEIGLGSYSTDLTVDQFEEGLLRLDALLADWAGRGVRLGYILPANFDNAAPDDEMAIPSWSRSAIITNLALAVAPSYGKTPSAETKVWADRGWDTIVMRCVKMPKTKLSAMPLGAGHKAIGAFSSNDPDDETLARPESSLDME